MTSASTSVGARENDRQGETERRNGKRNEDHISTIENGGVSQVRPGCDWETALLERKKKERADRPRIRRTQNRSQGGWVKEKGEVNRTRERNKARAASEARVECLP